MKLSERPALSAADSRPAPSSLESRPSCSTLVSSEVLAPSGALVVRLMKPLSLYPMAVVAVPLPSGNSPAVPLACRREREGKAGGRRAGGQPRRAVGVARLRPFQPRRGSARGGGAGPGSRGAREGG